MSEKTDTRDALKAFFIPEDLAHSHNSEDIDSLQKGIDGLDQILKIGSHEKCLKHVLKYAELNIKFMFMAHQCDKKALECALNMFLANMIKLFGKKDVSDGTMLP